MATTIQSIAHFLHQQGIHCEVDQVNSRIYLVINKKNLGRQYLAIQVSGQGNLVEFCVPNLFQLKDQVFKGVFMQTLLTIQRDVPLLKFLYVPTDESVAASIEIPLLDSPLTEANLLYCLEQLIVGLDEAMPRLQQVLATGKDPGQKSELEKWIEQMPQESFKQLAQLLQERQQKGSNN
jgi:hypothetical protein